MFVKKRLSVGVLFAFLLICFSAVAHAAYSYSVEVYVNGGKVYFPDQKPFIDTGVGRTYVPLRFVAEALGAQVSWDQASQTAVAVRKGQQVKMRIGSKYPEVNGSPVARELDAPAFILNGRTLVPLRFVSEAFGADVQWQPGKVGKVVITDSDAPKPKPEPVQVLERALGIEMINAEYSRRWVYDPSNIYRNGEKVDINREWREQNKDRSYARVVFEEEWVAWDGYRDPKQVQVGIQHVMSVGDIRPIQPDLTPVEKVLKAFFPGQDIKEVMDYAEYVAERRRATGGFESPPDRDFKVGGTTVTVSGAKDWWEGNNFVVVVIDNPR